MVIRLVESDKGANNNIPVGKFLCAFYPGCCACGFESFDIPVSRFDCF